MFQHRRPERAGDPLHGRDRQVDETHRRLQAIDDRKLRRRADLAEPLYGTGDFQANAGEQLSDFVVERSRKVAALLFASSLEMSG